MARRQQGLRHVGLLHGLGNTSEQSMHWSDVQHLKVEIYLGSEVFTLNTAYVKVATMSRLPPSRAHCRANEIRISRLFSAV